MEIKNRKENLRSNKIRQRKGKGGKEICKAERNEMRRDRKGKKTSSWSRTKRKQRISRTEKIRKK